MLLDLPNEIINGVLADAIEVQDNFDYLNMILSAPERGVMFNGKLVVTVASNNLTVALKTLGGSDPSTADPVYVRIGDTLRSVTSALSVTKNAATNWCNAGAAEHATKEIDYFVYLGYNATDGVVIGFSRFPGAYSYDDFSTTTTNEKYCAISTIANAVATDYYEVVGRFAATLSAGAGYTWSVPTYTAKNLIQFPIRETRWLDWLPTYTGYGGMTGYTTVTTHAKYKLSIRSCEFEIYASGTTTGSGDSFINFSVPFTPVVTTSAYHSRACFVYDAAYLIGFFRSATTTIAVGKYNLANWVIGAGRVIAGEMTYAI